MSKFVKIMSVVLSILFVATCVAITVFVFFNKNEIDTKQVEVTAVFSSEDKTTFDNKINDVTTSVKASDATDTRFDLLISVYGNLDSSMETLSAYFINTNFYVTDDNLSNYISNFYASRTRVNQIIDLYNLKCEFSSQINKNVAANDIYLEMTNYLINYTKVIDQLSSNIGNHINKSANLKFAMIDLYNNIARKDLAECDKDSNNYLKLKSSEDLTFINSNFAIKFGEIYNLKAGEEFSINSYNFIKFYSSCDKTSLLNGFKSKVESATISSTSTKEDLSAYYYKVIYGV